MGRYRDVISFAKRHALRLYLAIVHLCAVAMVLYLVVSFPVGEVSWRALLFWLLFGIASWAPSFDAALFGSQRLQVSVGYASSVAIIVLFPPPVAALAVIFGSLTWKQLSGKTEWHKVAFNRSMHGLCAGFSALVYTGLAGDELHVPRMVGAALVVSLTYFLLNTSLVSLVISLASGEDVRRVWAFMSSPAQLSVTLALGVLGVLLAIVYLTVGPWGVVLLTLPLVASHYAMRQVAEVRQFYGQVVQSLADSLDLRDRETAGQSARVAGMARRLAETMRLGGSQVEQVYIAGMLHDLGKIGLGDDVLGGNQVLTEEQWARVRLHPVRGAQLLEAYPHLKEVAQIVRHHHERFDGSGYPDGLKGEEIPLGARIVTVADAFIAMYFGRLYQEPKTWEEAVQELQHWSGSQFDPKVVEAFVRTDWHDELMLQPTQEVASAD